MTKPKIHVIENVVSSAYADAIEGLFLGADFPWYLNTNTVGYWLEGDKNGVDSPQFTHTFVRDGARSSGAWSPETLVYAFEQKAGLGVGNPFRVKANMNTQDLAVDGKHYPVHFDSDQPTPFLTCVYYVNDCDGDTLFFDDEFNVFERLTPKKGTLVYFDGNVRHAGCAPKIATNRCVININFNRESWLGETND